MVTVGTPAPAFEVPPLGDIVSIREGAPSLDRLVAEHSCGILVLGASLGPIEASALITRVRRIDSSATWRFIAIGVGSQISLFQDQIDDDSIFYLSPVEISAADLSALVAAALAVKCTVSQEPDDYPPAPREVVERASLQTSLIDLARLMVEVAPVHLRATHCSVFTFSQATQYLESLASTVAGTWRASASAGVSGFTARTGRITTSNCLEKDPKYDPDVDNPGASATGPFISAPIHDPRSRVVGVIGIAREAGRPEFSAADQCQVTELIHAIEPYFVVLSTQQSLRSEATPLAEGADDIFRGEALAHYQTGPGVEGRLLSTIPTWLRRAPLWILATALLLAVVATLLPIAQYAAGPALVRAQSEFTLRAVGGGQIESLSISIGQHVRKGDLLGRFRRHPDNTVEPLWSGTNGTVMGLFASTGQWLQANDPIAQIVDTTRGFEALIFVGASYAPQLMSGMPVVLRLDGYSQHPILLEVTDVGPVLSTRSEVVRLGGESIAASGPLVVVRTRLPDYVTLRSGNRLVFRRPMNGRAEIRLSSDSLRHRLTRRLSGELF